MEGDPAVGLCISGSAGSFSAKLRTMYVNGEPLNSSSIMPQAWKGNPIMAPILWNPANIAGSLVKVHGVARQIHSIPLVACQLDNGGWAYL